MMSISNILIVAAGGALGSAARYAVGCAMRGLWPAVGIAGTLTVNCVGSLLIGLVAGWLSGTSMAEPMRNAAQLLLVTGVLGGFTTFSAFSLECVKYISAGNMMSAIGYICVSILAGVVLAAVGMYLGSQI